MLQSTTTGGIATLRLDRPDRGNALSEPLVSGLQAGIASALADDSVHTLVFRGEGAHFCTGFDLSSLESETDASLAARFIAVESLLQTVWHAPVRTVAVAQGRTWGAGADLFASCDVRAAGRDASFRFPGSAFGIVLGTRRLVEAIGWDASRALVTEGASVDASRARELGLATDLIDMDAGAWLTRRLAEAPVADRETFAAIRGVARGDHRGEDMASLRRSAERPGLQQRIAAYRERLKASR